MATIKMTQNSYVDFEARAWFKAHGVENVIFTPKVVKMKNDAKVVLVHIQGVNPEDGQRVDVDLWPRRNTTEKDIEKLPENFDDIVFRIGYHTEKDLATGEEITVEGQPKMACYRMKGKDVLFSGSVKQFEDDWTNEEPVSEEA